MAHRIVCIVVSTHGAIFSGHVVFGLFPGFFNQVRERLITAPNLHGEQLSGTLPVSIFAHVSVPYASHRQDIDKRSSGASNGDHDLSFYVTHKASVKHWSDTLRSLDMENICVETDTF